MHSFAVPSDDVAALFETSPRGASQVILGLTPLADPRAAHLTFVSDVTKSATQLEAALAAGAVVLYPVVAELHDPLEGTLIAVTNPRAAFASAVTAFFEEKALPGIHPTAIVHPTAEVHPTVHVGAYTVVGPGVVVGEGSEIRNHVVLAARVRLGSYALVKSHAVIGEEGFGIDKDAAGNNLRLPHVGSVVVGDHVEIGNFTTVCSGTISPTTIGDFTKIDDHVHISHNCRIGRNCIITACAEISGSVTVGDRTWIGPNASIIQKLDIGENSLIGMASVVIKSIGPNEVHFGNPARKVRDQQPFAS